MDERKNVTNLVEGDVDGDVTQVGNAGGDSDVTNVVRGTVRGFVLQVGSVRDVIVRRSGDDD